MSNTWTQVSTLPKHFNNGSAIVYDGKIHIIGGGSSQEEYQHYSWDGTSWTQETSLNYDYDKGNIVIYDNKIHIIGGGGYGSLACQRHYSWDGTSWDSVSTLPISFYTGCATVYDGKIHILGGYQSKKKHYSWDGSSWTAETDLPLELYDGCTAITFNNKIHIYGFRKGQGTTDLPTMHYTWDETDGYVYINDLPDNYLFTTSVIFDNKVHLFGQHVSTQAGYYITSNGGSTYTIEDNPPYDYLAYSQAVVYNNKLHILGGYDYNTVGQNHYALDYTPPGPTPPGPTPPGTDELKVLDLFGTAYVANKVNEKLKTVTTMPSNPTNGMTVLYLGTSTNNYTNGYIYSYNTSTSSWVAKGIYPTIEGTAIVFNA